MYVIVLSERAKKCNSLILSKLPHGPTAFFKVSNVQVSDSVPGAGRRTEHQPEIRRQLHDAVGAASATYRPCSTASRRSRDDSA